MGDDANAALTQAAPTELAPADYEAEAAFAWAFDPDDDAPTQRLTSRRITAAGVAVSLVAIAAAGVVALVFLRDRAPDPPPVVAEATTQDPPEPIRLPEPPRPHTGWLPPPSTPPPVTVTAPPVTVSAKPAPAPQPAQIPPDVIAAADRQLLARLQADGWTITSADAMVKNAHVVCSLLYKGATPEYVNGQLMTFGGMSPTEAMMFSSAVVQIYLSCP